MSDVTFGSLSGLLRQADRVSRSELDRPDALGTLREATGSASELLKALSHETRLTVLCLLSLGEMSVSEIESLVSLPQATLSQQLARLRLEGLVSTRREGRLIHYRLASKEVHALVEAMSTVLSLPVGEALEQIVNAERQRLAALNRPA